jgi:hypothetical protein
MSSIASVKSRLKYNGSDGSRYTLANNQLTMDQSATIAKIESFFKTNITQMVTYFATQFDCKKTQA